MARIRKAVLFLSMFLMAQMAMTEKIEFVNTVGPSGTTCFLENIGESIQGKYFTKNSDPQKPGRTTNHYPNYRAFFSHYSRGTSQIRHPQSDLDDY